MLSALLGTTTPTTESAADRPGPADDYWYNLDNVAGGERMTPEQAARVSTVYACIRVLAETLAQLPLHVYTRADDGTRSINKAHPLYDILHKQPNDWQTAFDFVEHGMTCLNLRGNYYARRHASPTTAVAELEPLHPDDVKPELTRGRRMRYVYQPTGRRKRLFDQSQIFHVRALTIDGVVGMAPIEATRKRLSVTNASDAHASEFYRNQAMPGGILSTPNKLSPENRQRNKASWQAAHATPGKRFQVAVLDNALEYKPLTMTNRDAQFIDIRRYSDEDIARAFRVPAHLVNILDRATYSNITQQSLEFVIYTMLPWARRWEAAIGRDLIGEPDVFAEFNFSGILRGDTQTRYAAYAVALQNGFLSVNDVRRLENMNPITGGDVYQSPLNQAPLGPAAVTPAHQARHGSPAGDVDLKPLVDDAAARVAGFERKTLQARADKHGSDRERFAKLADRFFTDTSAQYLRTVAAPILSAAGVPAERVAFVVDRLTASGRLVAAQLDAEPADIVEHFGDERRREITTTLLETLTQGTPAQ